jgi:N-acetyl sugar amidotransferase
MIYCKKCVYPITAVNLKLEEDGICSACKVFELFEKITDDEWKVRRKKFEEIINTAKKNNVKNSNYDCVIPVSGGKDSYFQTHLIVKEYGLKPLLVTYHGNNYLPEGDYNRDRMRELFDADHIVWGPSVDVLKKLNRIGFEKMGDMNWHGHCGIFTAPHIIATKFNIPLVIWGESPFDIAGMFHPDDYPEFTNRHRIDHALRGYEWSDIIDTQKENLLEKDMIWAKYPLDIEIINSQLRGIYIGNYFKWDPNQHTKKMIELYGWKEYEKGFQRTYRKMSNLDDRYESGIHDLLKFIKFGYGRCSDHASKDIRTGYMNREEAVKLVMKYDHVVSDDLDYWLKYVGKDKNYFWKIADTFRDSRVWTIQKGNWIKQNLDGSISEYGKVHLTNEEIDFFNKKKSKLVR